MSAAAPAVDSIFRALGDPTRRSVVERLGKSPASVTELARPFGLALPTLLQHLKVLEASGLVFSHKQGRVRTYRLAPQCLRVAEDWLSDQRAEWEKRLDRLESYINEMQEKPE